MINDIRDIEDALYDWVTSVTALPTIFAHQESPRPLNAYVLIDIPSIISVGQPDNIPTLLVDNTADIDYSYFEEVFVSISAFYDASYNICRSIKNSLNKYKVIESLYADGLGFARAGPINDIPEIISSEWEQRAQFDCFFHLRSKDTENIETIDKIEINNNVVQKP